MTIKTLVFAIAILLLFPTWAFSNKEDAVVEMYNNSTNLPDSHAYRGFLNVIESATQRPGHEVHVIESALGIDIDTEAGAIRAASQFEWFLASSREAQAESERLKIETLCPQNWAEMSFTEIQEARWAINDAEDKVFLEYFNAALKRLSSAEKAAFREYIAEFKKGVTFTRIDTEKLYGDRAESKSRSYQESVCASKASLSDA